MSAPDVGEESMGLDRPEGLDDDEWVAYLEGFRQAMVLVGMAANAWAGKAGEESAGDDGVCGDCGTEKINAIGREDKACPVCEL